MTGPHGWIYTTSRDMTPVLLFNSAGSPSSPTFVPFSTTQYFYVWDVSGRILKIRAGDGLAEPPRAALSQGLRVQYSSSPGLASSAPPPARMIWIYLSASPLAGLLVPVHSLVHFTEPRTGMTGAGASIKTLPIPTLPTTLSPMSAGASPSQSTASPQAPPGRSTSTTSSFRSTLETPPVGCKFPVTPAHAAAMFVS